jgi:predicted phage terminase large subunit-like protein
MFADDRLGDVEVDALTEGDLAAFTARQVWLDTARYEQLPHGTAAIPDWLIYLMRCGRGFGKSRSMYEWAWWEAWRVPNLIVHAVAPTLSDVSGTTFEGPAGFCSLIPVECLYGGTLERAYNKTKHQIRLSNGSLIRGFGAVEEAGRLRGPQCHALVGDELREWDRPAGNLETAFNNAMYGLRLPYPDGTPSRAVLGTTPKPIPFLKRLEHRENLVVVHRPSRDNLINLAPAFRAQLVAQQGTMMGKQETDALYVDEESELSIIKRHWIKLWPKDKPLPEFSFIVESYDTASSEENYDVKRQATDPSGSIILGVFNVEQQFTEDERRRLGVRSRYAALLLDAWAERLGLPDLLERARAQHRVKYGKPGRRPDVVIIEDKNSGPALRQFLNKWGVPSWPYNPGRQSKTTRLHAASPLIMQGMLFVPESRLPDRAGLPRDWCDDFMEQVCAYAGPGSTEHDEYVDCLSQAFSYLSDRGILDATPNEKYVDLEEKKEVEEQAARREYERENAKRRVNPYG